MSQQGSSPSFTVPVHKPHVLQSPRRFKCSLCSRQFNRREHLQRHHSIHFSQKDHHCHLCDYACRRKDLLNRHVKLSHTNKRPDAAKEPEVSNTSNGTVGQDSQPDDTSVTADTDFCLQPPSVSSNAILISNTAESAEQITFGEPPLSTPWPTSDPLSLTFNYLDSVNLPFFDEQPAFYPELSLNNPIMFTSPVIHGAGTGGDHMDSNQRENQVTGRPGALSRLGSLSPDLHNTTIQSERMVAVQTTAAALRFSQEDWAWISARVDQFSSILPPEYILPSRHAFSRYLHAFVTGFHPHFPILHLATLSIRQMAPELVVALAAVGAHYCLELHRAVELFNIARAIALEHVRRREVECENEDTMLNPADILPTPPESNDEYVVRTTPNVPRPAESHQTLTDPAVLDTIKALFFLMAIATWSRGHRPLVRQAISIQSVLAILIRQDGLQELPTEPATWEEWIQRESARRTKLVIFSFFNLHRILLNIPSPIMISDIKLRLPCPEVEWKASTLASWETFNQSSDLPPLFQDYFSGLFNPTESGPTCSSFGTHIMIHALLQHIFSVKQTGGLSNPTGELEPGTLAVLEKALKKWQRDWELNSESSLNPLDKHGPISFNSTALFHLAYVRLAVETGHARSILDQTHIDIAERLINLPSMQRGPMLTLAARHATAALCPPVQMGVCSVGRAPSWSVMHAVCSLDYAYILNEFLQRTTSRCPDPPLSPEEQTVLSVLEETLEEVEYSSSLGHPCKIGSAPHLFGFKAVRAWAIILQGMKTWNAVDFIAKTLFTYADLLEKHASPLT